MKQREDFIHIMFLVSMVLPSYLILAEKLKPNIHGFNSADEQIVVDLTRKYGFLAQNINPQNIKYMVPDAPQMIIDQNMTTKSIRFKGSAWAAGYRIFRKVGNYKLDSKKVPHYKHFPYNRWRFVGIVRDSVLSGKTIFSDPNDIPGNGLGVHYYILPISVDGRFRYTSSLQIGPFFA
jgi:hypothetical protein